MMSRTSWKSFDEGSSSAAALASMSLKDDNSSGAGTVNGGSAIGPTPHSPRPLEVIAEDRVSGDEGSSGGGDQQQHPSAARSKRANMVKKALTYFSDKSNRSISEDNLYTRRKNLAVHLGLDDKIGIREIQKINTFCLPVPAPPYDEAQEPAAVAREVEVVNDDVKVKDLVRFLGIKDGLTASMASQGALSDDLQSSSTSHMSDGTQLEPPLPSQRRSRSFEIQAQIIENSAKANEKKDSFKRKK